MAALDEDTIDELLYLARVNEVAELESYLSQLATQTQRSVAELVAAAVDPYSKNSALHYAAANGHNDMIKLLVSSSTEKKATPELVNAINDAGNTPLHWAALNGHLESAKLLMQSGADVTVFNRAGHDAVFEAEINDKKDVVDWLLGAVQELEEGIGQQQVDASSRGNRGGDRNGGDEDGSSDKKTLLHEASAAASSTDHVEKQVEAMKIREDAPRSD